MVCVHLEFLRSSLAPGLHLTQVSLFSLLNAMQWCNLWLSPTKTTNCWKARQSCTLTIFSTVGSSFIFVVNTCLPPDFSIPSFQQLFLCNCAARWKWNQFELPSRAELYPNMQWVGLADYLNNYKMSTSLLQALNMTRYQGSNSPSFQERYTGRETHSCFVRQFWWREWIGWSAEPRKKL